MLDIQRYLGLYFTCKENNVWHLFDALDGNDHF